MCFFSLSEYHNLSVPMLHSDSESSDSGDDFPTLVPTAGHHTSDVDNENDNLNPDEFKAVPVRQRYFQDYEFDADFPPGPQVDVDEKNAGELFIDMMKKPLELMVLETNRHAKAKFEAVDKPWKEFTLPEAYDFVGLCLLTGIMVKTDIKDYWSKDPVYETPIFGKVMSRDRFLNLLHNIHFVDPEEAAEEGWDDKDSGNYDPIHKIRRFFDMCFDSFYQAYVPAKQISVDEQIVAFLGRCGFKMLIRGKPHPVGIKIFALCESTTGYNLSSLIYCRERYPKQLEGKGETYATVWELLRKANCFQKGHELYCDNWYTYRNLFQDLAKRKVYCCGTVKSMKGLPTPFADKNSAFSRNMNRGEMYFLHTDSCTIVNWKDKKTVVALSTLPDVVDERTVCTRKIVVNDLNTGGTKWEPHGQVPQPLLIHNYNQYMGGVDHCDQMLNYLLRHFRCRRWYMQICMYLLKTAAINIHIMKRAILPRDQWERYTLKRCIKEIIDELFRQGLHRTPLPVTVEQIAPAEKTTYSCEDTKGYHFMEKIGDGTKYYRCVYHRKLNSPPKNRKTVNHRCIDCCVPLCWDCWVPFHLEAFKKVGV